jgi:hypothetical protein
MSEKDGDEIYINFSAETLGGAVMGTERVPANMEFWQMYNGSRIEPKHMLFIGQLEQGLRFTVTLMEMDILQIIKNSLSVVGTMVDDFVGRIQIQVSPNGSISWAPVKHAEDKGEVAPGLREIRFTGNKSEYLVQLEARVVPH